MPRRDESGEEDPRGANAASAINKIGHSKSGGHNQIFQDPNADDDTGGDGPYTFVEYPKHVTVGGVTYTANDAAHEAQIKGL